MVGKDVGKAVGIVVGRPVGELGRVLESVLGKELDAS